MVAKIKIIWIGKGFLTAVEEINPMEGGAVPLAVSHKIPIF